MAGMTKTKVLACRDAGVDCDYVARGATDEEVLRDAAQHAKAVHGYTDEQLRDPQLQQTLRGLIHEERP
jgi:predicted small metal-binding protein